MKRIMTLNRFIIEEQRKHPRATGSFTGLLNDIAFAAKLISYHTNKAGLVDILGETGARNVHGERVQKLDIFAHEALVQSMSHGGNLCAMASEEEEEAIDIPAEYPLGSYVCIFDPLDGSSNIDVNVAVGTIFSIFRRADSGDKRCGPGDLLQPGRAQVCAGYIVYGSSTMFVYTTGNGVNGFTLDPGYGEFVLSHPDIRIPDRAKIYSVNESSLASWAKGIREYVSHVKEEDPATGRPLNARYIGSLVSDIHRNLLAGGIFLYPASGKSPRGKLRLMYEANPMAFIMEQAGGRASDGVTDILDIRPSSLHERVPLIIGPAYDVGMVEDFIKKYG